MPNTIAWKKVLNFPTWAILMRRNSVFSISGKIAFCAILTASAAQTASATINWDWPSRGTIPSDQKQIDKAYEAYQEGDSDTAILILNGVKGAQNQDCRVRHILADIYVTQKRYGDAKREFQDLYQTETNLEKANTAKIGWVDPPQIRYEFAQTAMLEGSYGEAINIFRELQNQKPTWIQPRLGIAECYETQGDHEQAHNHYKALLESGIPMDFEYKIIIKQRLDNMKKQLERAQAGGNNAQQPNVPPPEQGSTGRTLGSGGSLLGTSPMHGSSMGSPSIHGSSQVAFNRPAEPPRNAGTTLKTGPLEDASIDIRNRKFDSAITRLKDYLTRQPKDGQAHYLLAVSYASTRQYTLAREAYEKTLQYGELSLQRLATVGLSKLPKTPPVN